jgi:hypothetical protein
MQRKHFKHDESSSALMPAVPGEAALDILARYKHNTAALGAQWETLVASYPNRWVAVTDDGRVQAASEYRKLLRDLTSSGQLATAAIEYVFVDIDPVINRE